MKQQFSGLEVTTFFGSNNSANIEAMKAILFSKCSKFYVDFENAIKICENFTVLKIIAFKVKSLFP